MILQEHVEREPKPAFRQTARALVTGGTAFGEQLWRRLVLIEILRERRCAQRGHHGNSEDGAARLD